MFATSCNSDSSESKDTDKKDSTVVVEEKGPVLDTGKVYGFMELKELYNQNWKGEEAGNTFLDGKTVTITGEVFSRGSISAMSGNEIVVKGANVKFRGGKFTDPDSGHDVECVFPATEANQVSSLAEGSKVTVKGVLEKQEIYIESADFRYNVLVLKDCHLVK